MTPVRQATRLGRRFLPFALIGAALYLPARFLFSIGTSFYVDWANHEWLVGYFGQYFRVHHVMPSVLHTPQLCGVPLPAFYGHLFYPLLGLASAIFAPGIVIRVAAIAMFIAQYALVVRAFERLGASKYIAGVFGCLVIWAIYPLTNLYNRSALTEFFATAFLVCAAALLSLLICAREGRARRLYASSFVFSLTMSAGTHPITALYGVPFFIVMSPFVWWLLRDDRQHRLQVVRAIAVWIPLAIICLLPWYLVASRLSSSISIGGDAPTVGFFHDSIDSWLTRFFPLPRDTRVADGVPLAQVSTPYLDAQVSITLVVMFVSAGLIALRARHRDAIVAWGYALVFVVAFLLMSLVPYSYTLLPARAGSIQFAYRAVSYVNLAALLGVLLILKASPDIGRVLRGRAMLGIATACLALSFIGVIVKWGHVAAIRGTDSSPHVFLDRGERQALVQLPRWFYGAKDYAAPKLYAQVATPSDVGVQQSFEVGNDDSRFGKLRVMHIDMAKAGWLSTDVLAFPWNEIVVDGVAVPRGELRNNDDDIAVFLLEGKHTVATRFRPPSWWPALRNLALIASLAWTLYLLVTFGRFVASRLRVAIAQRR